MKLWSIHSCFYFYKDFKNRPRSASVVVENKHLYLSKMFAQVETTNNIQSLRKRRSIGNQK